MGNNFPSKYRSNEGITFGAKSNVKDSRDNYPGPGSYPLPSDFGVYFPKNYPEENVYTEPKKEVDPRPWRHGMKQIQEEQEEDNAGKYDYKDEENKDENKDEHKDEHKDENKEEKENKEETPKPEENNEEKDKKEEE